MDKLHIGSTVRMTKERYLYTATFEWCPFNRERKHGDVLNYCIYTSTYNCFDIFSTCKFQRNTLLLLFSPGRLMGLIS